MKLEEFLNAKPLFYKKIDYERMPVIYESIKNYLPEVKIIHIIGTNGKGTTGRFLASALHSIGFSVGHYTSPHISKFNERIWINAKDVSDSELDEAHKKLQTILTPSQSKSLSYFEYTTLLSMFIFQNCNYVIMEAGLGGEHDATAVFDKILTLVTPIGIDHNTFLGNTVKEIATTKLKAIQDCAISATQESSDVYKVAKYLRKKVLDVNTFIKDSDKKKIETIAQELNLAQYLIENLKLSIAALKYLNLKYSSEDFKNSKLFGRATKINDNIIVDVGHNILAAKSLVKSLSPKKYTLIYNTYDDKEYQSILEILKEIIIDVEIINIQTQRALDVDLLVDTLIGLKIKYKKFTHIDKDKNYLVFGSFSVVEAFMRSYNG